MRSLSLLLPLATLVFSNSAIADSPRPVPLLPTWAVRFTSPKGTGRVDYANLGRVLEAFGPVNRESMEEREVIFTVATQTLDRARVAAALRPHRLDFHLLAQDQSPLGAMPADGGTRGGEASTCQALGRVAAGLKLNPGTWASCGCTETPTERTYCRLQILERQPFLAGALLVRAQADLIDFGRVYLTLEFGPEGQRLLAERTRAARGRLFSPVLDGETLYTVRIVDPITGTTLKLPLTAASTPMVELDQAKAIAASMTQAMSATLLEGRWTVAEVKRADAP
jgi:hypothetical protein